MPDMNLTITIPSDAVPVLKTWLDGQEELTGTTIQKAEKVVAVFLGNQYHRLAKAKGGRDFGVAEQAASEARSAAESQSQVDRKAAEITAEDAAKVTWSV